MRRSDWHQLGEHDVLCPRGRRRGPRFRLVQRDHFARWIAARLDERGQPAALVTLRASPSDWRLVRKATQS